MSSSEKQEGGRESQSTISSPESLVTTGVDNIFRDQDCIKDHVVSTPDPLPGENASHRVCGVESPIENVVADEQVNTTTTSPVIPQIPGTLASAISSSLSTDERDESHHDSEDLESSLMQGMIYEDATIPQNHRGSAVRIVGELCKLSDVVHKHPEISDKSQEMDTANLIGPLDYAPDDATTAVTTALTNIQTAPPAHELSTAVLLNPHQQVKSNQRIENLPRLKLLDLPLLGITPPSQDTNAAPPTLGKIQASPPSDACALRSPEDRDPKEICQLSQTHHRLADLPCQQPLSVPEPHISTTSASNTISTLIDESPDDEVTFIISIPKRRKKRKRTEPSVAHRPAEEPAAGESHTATPANSISSQAHPTISTVRSSSVSQTSGKIGPTASASPIADISTTVAGPSSSLEVDSVSTVPQVNAQKCNPSHGHLSPVKEVTSSQRVPETVRSLEASAPAAASKNKASVETVHTSQAKRKVDQTVGQDCDSTSPVKRSKLQNDQQGQGRSTIIPTGQGQIGTRWCGTPPDSPSATSTSNTGIQSRNLGITNSEVPAVSPSSLDRRSPAQSSSLQMPETYRVPLNNALRDLRRKPSLYSIPSWPSPPASCSSGNQQRRPTVEAATNPSNVSSQVTQTPKSLPLVPGQAPFSQQAQRNASDYRLSPSVISKSPYSPVSPTAVPSQPYVIKRSIDHQDRPANSPGQNIYAVSTWPPRQFLTVGQQMQKDGIRFQPQQFTLTPQEYARSLHSQYAQSTKDRDDASFPPQSRCATPQMRIAESSRNQSSNDPSQQTMNQSETSPSTNLLVDIAQTCQSIFPFARIAERHNQPVKKVFDAFSAVIQIPLLQCAADRRRNGKLGVARMKNFREASKAASETNEKERKSEKHAAKLRDELAPPPAKKARGKAKSAGGKGLLGMAIANSQRNASGSK